ncbi:MAG: transporter [Phycisphaerae bacterium]|nr:transporter [Phycisphaerae bacterium]
MADSAPLHPIEASALHARRERVFLVLAGLFLGSLTMLNILGISRFVKLFTLGPQESPLVFAVAVGVIPYPVTFLCTDFISEFYGRSRANAVVWMGLFLNIFVVGVLWVGGALPGFEALDSDGAIAKDVAGRLPVFFEVRTLAFGAVVASMLAYLAAQLCDVHVFHFWKRVTQGKHLWLRNNGSTLVSQVVDTVMVILVTYWIGGLSGVIDADRPASGQLLLLMGTGYLFKFSIALIDTIPFYLGSKWLRRYLRYDPITERNLTKEEACQSSAAFSTDPSPATKSTKTN